MSYPDEPGDVPDTFAGPGRLDREPPHDLDAEQAVLGAMLLSRSVIDPVSVTLDPESFYRPAHQTIYRAIIALHGADKAAAVDPITVGAELLKGGDLDRIGGAPYLHHLVDSTPTAANAEHYAEIIAERAMLRRVVEAGHRAAQRAYGVNGSAAEILDEAMRDLQAAAAGASTAVEARLSVGERWEGFLDELEAGRDPRALDTPWPDLSEVIELKPGQLITVGAGTGGGKSLLGMNLAAWCALTHGRPALVASMEMGGSELLARLTAAEASVPLDRLVRRQLEEGDWTKIARATERLQRAHNFILDDSANLSLSKIRARMRWMHSISQAPALVVVDYLQLMTPEGSKSTTSRAQEVATISRGLKLLAGEFEVPVVALAQFNRGAVGRQPMVSDFKDSSSIEQDSDVIVLGHRPLAEDGSDTVRPGEFDLIVAKNRNGPSGRIVTLAWQGHYARLRSMGAR